MENAKANEYVGCVAYPNVEAGVSFHAQQFEKGAILFVSGGGFPDATAVFVLYGDNMKWDKVAAAADASPSLIGTPPAGKFSPAGRVGWVWQQGAGVSERLGWAIAPERTGQYGDPTSNGAWQQFMRGYMFWIPWAQPDGPYIYVLASSYAYPPGGNRADWLEFKDTWAP